MLVREVCGRAAAAGAVRVQLETAVDNHAAKALYAAEGFEIERGFDRLSRRLSIPGGARARGARGSKRSWGERFAPCGRAAAGPLGTWFESIME